MPLSLPRYRRAASRQGRAIPSQYCTACFRRFEAAQPNVSRRARGAYPRVTPTDSLRKPTSGLDPTAKLWPLSTSEPWQGTALSAIPIRLAPNFLVQLLVPLSSPSPPLSGACPIFARAHPGDKVTRPYPPQSAAAPTARTWPNRLDHPSLQPSLQR
jgi:hypothetical protein